MLLAGASGLIYYCRSSAPGSKHDSSVFKSSPLFHKLSVEKWNPLRNGIIAGDSGYATYYPFLSTPFCEATQNPREVEYNKKFCAARVHVENAIGRLKNRWRILLGSGIRIRDMNSCAKLVQCCVAMNNFIIMKGSESMLDIPTNTDEGEEEEEVPNWDEIPDELRNGRLRKKPTKEKILDAYF